MREHSAVSAPGEVNDRAVLRADLGRSSSEVSEGARRDHEANEREASCSRRTGIALCALNALYPLDTLLALRSSIALRACGAICASRSLDSLLTLRPLCSCGTVSTSIALDSLWSLWAFWSRWSCWPLTSRKLGWLAVCGGAVVDLASLAVGKDELWALGAECKSVCTGDHLLKIPVHSVVDRQKNSQALALGTSTAALAAALLIEAPEGG